MNDPYRKVTTLEVIILVLLILLIIVVVVVIFWTKKRGKDCGCIKEHYKSFSEFGYNPPATVTIIPKYIDSTLPIVDPDLCFDRDTANGFPSRRDTKLIYDDEESTPIDSESEESEDEPEFMG